MNIKTLVLILLLLNSLSFICARLIDAVDRDNGALFCSYNASNDAPDEVTYLVAGNLNQPEPAFEFLKSELHGGVVLANFSNFGWNAKSTAEHIIEDVIRNNYKKVNVYTISLGDHVARYLERDLGKMCDLRIISINPCPTRACVKEPLKSLLWIAPLFEVACHGLGWLSMIPIIPVPEGRYSLVLLADQYWTVAFDKAPHMTEHTVGVICSKPNVENDFDGFLDNAVVRQYFDSVTIVDIPTNHGDTIGAADEYLSGMQQIFANLVEDK